MENKNPFFFPERIQIELENWVEYKKNKPKELLIGYSYVAVGSRPCFHLRLKVGDVARS